MKYSIIQEGGNGSFLLTNYVINDNYVLFMKMACFFYEKL